MIRWTMVCKGNAILISWGGNRLDRFFRYMVLIIMFIVSESISDFTIHSDIITSIAFHLFKWMIGFVLVREAYKDGLKDAKKVKL